MYQNYTINQLCLPIDLEIKLEENDFAHAIVQFVDSIPDEVFLPYYQSMGRPQYHPRMLLSIILCAYIQGVYSGRQIQNMLIDIIRMRYLSQEQFPNFRTINRFRVHPIMNDILDHSFVQFRELLVQSGLISGSALYIDGTKIEADANKYSFVWKKSILKYKDSLDQKALENYQQMVETKILPELIDDLKDKLSIEEIERIRQSLEEKENQLIEAIDQTETVEERKLLRKEKSEVHKQKKRFDDFAQRKMSYEEQLVIMGVRNSFSKTDHDATFMRMKEDHMLNGQLKPGYNIQLATENQFALAYDCYPNPTDTRTFIPFLEKIESKIGLPENIVADAGYASEENYCYVLDETESTPIIPHQGYLKEKKRAHKQNQFHRDNWTYNELDDYYICPNQKRVVFSHYSQRKDRNGFIRNFKIYECEDCTGCPLREKCTKAKEGKNRRLNINPTWEYIKIKANEKIESKETASYYAQRKIDVETVFGNIKQNMKFKRFHVRGAEKIFKEMGLVFLAHNFRKLVTRVRKYEGKTIIQNQI